MKISHILRKPVTEASMAGTPADVMDKMIQDYLSAAELVGRPALGGIGRALNKPRLGWMAGLIPLMPQPAGEHDSMSLEDQAWRQAISRGYPPDQAEAWGKHVADMGPNSREGLMVQGYDVTDVDLQPPGMSPWPGQTDSGVTGSDAAQAAPGTHDASREPAAVAGGRADRDQTDTSAMGTHDASREPSDAAPGRTDRDQTDATAAGDTAAPSSSDTGDTASAGDAGDKSAAGGADGDAAEPNYDDLTFSQAFARARARARQMDPEHAGQYTFTWHGKPYQTNIQGTGTKSKPQEPYIPQKQQRGMVSTAPIANPYENPRKPVREQDENTVRELAKLYQQLDDATNHSQAQQIRSRIAGMLSSIPDADQVANTAYQRYVKGDILESKKKSRARLAEVEQDLSPEAQEVLRKMRAQLAQLQFGTPAADATSKPAPDTVKDRSLIGPAGERIGQPPRNIKPTPGPALTADLPSVAKAVTTSSWLSRAWEAGGVMGLWQAAMELYNAYSEAIQDIAQLQPNDPQRRDKIHHIIAQLAGKYGTRTIVITLGTVLGAIYAGKLRQTPGKIKWMLEFIGSIAGATAAEYLVDQFGDNPEKFADWLYTTLYGADGTAEPDWNAVMRALQQPSAWPLKEATQAEIEARMQQIMRDAGWLPAEPSAAGTTGAAVAPPAGAAAPPPPPPKPSSTSSSAPPPDVPPELTDVAAAKAAAESSSVLGRAWRRIGGWRGVIVVNGLTILYAAWETYLRISQIPANDPQRREKILQLVGHLVDRFGLNIVANVLGMMVASTMFPRLGTLGQLVAGIGAGYEADRYFGNDVKNFVDWIIKTIFVDKKMPQTGSAPSMDDVLRALSSQSDDTVDENYQIQMAKDSAVMGGQHFVREGGDHDGGPAMGDLLMIHLPDGRGISAPIAEIRGNSMVVDLDETGHQWLEESPDHHALKIDDSEGNISSTGQLWNSMVDLLKHDTPAGWADVFLRTGYGDDPMDMPRKWARLWRLQHAQLGDELTYGDVMTWVQDTESALQDRQLEESQHSALQGHKLQRWLDAKDPAMLAVWMASRAGTRGMSVAKFAREQAVKSGLSPDHWWGRIRNLVNEQQQSKTTPLLRKYDLEPLTHLDGDYYLTSMVHDTGDSRKIEYDLVKRVRDTDDKFTPAYQWVANLDVSSYRVSKEDLLAAAHEAMQRDQSMQEQAVPGAKVPVSAIVRQVMAGKLPGVPQLQAVPGGFDMACQGMQGLTGNEELEMEQALFRAGYDIKSVTITPNVMEIRFRDRHMVESMEDPQAAEKRYYIVKKRSPSAPVPGQQGFHSVNAAKTQLASMPDKDRYTIRQIDSPKRVAESKQRRDYNFTVSDLHKLEKMTDIDAARDHVMQLLTAGSRFPMKPEKTAWFKNHIQHIKTIHGLVKMMYDLMLAGEGHKVLGTPQGMGANIYRKRFDEASVEDLTDAISRRLLKTKMANHMLRKHGLDKTLDAIRSVAELHTDLEEIGSSDVSIMIKQIADQLGMHEAKYHGKEVKLGKPIRTPTSQGGKFKVYVRDPKTGDIKMVRFGDTTGLTIKRDDPKRRKSFRARHHCDNPGPRTKARYWSCKMWTRKPVGQILKGK
jgi:hypothetical protein